jgi:hypothetical protein
MTPIDTTTTPAGHHRQALPHRRRDHLGRQDRLCRQHLGTVTPISLTTGTAGGPIGVGKNPFAIAIVR